MLLEKNPASRRSRGGSSNARMAAWWYGSPMCSAQYFGETVTGRPVAIPSISGSNLAFLGGYSDGTGIYTGSVGATGAAKVVDLGDTAPGHGAFTFLGVPSLSGNNVVFAGLWGSIEDGDGIYTASVGVAGVAKVVDHQGNEFTIPPGKDTIALCRCGQSKNKPFCDGSHKTCGFVAAELARLNAT